VIFQFLSLADEPSEALDTVIGRKGQ